MKIIAYINHVFISFSAVHIWYFTYSLVFFTFYGYVTNSQYEQLPFGLIAQLVEHSAPVSQRSWIRSLSIFTFNAIDVSCIMASYDLIGYYLNSQVLLSIAWPCAVVYSNRAFAFDGRTDFFKGITIFCWVMVILFQLVFVFSINKNKNFFRQTSYCTLVVSISTSLWILGKLLLLRQVFETVAGNLEYTRN